MSDKSSELREFLANIQLWRGLAEDQLDALAKIAIPKALRGAKRPHSLSQALGAWLNRLPNLEERFKTRKLGLQYSANL